MVHFNSTLTHLSEKHSDGLSTYHVKNHVVAETSSGQSLSFSR